MSEEVEVQEVPQVELQAREMGWLPKEEYEASGRDASRWVPAETFVDRAPLFEKIDETTKHAKALQKRLEQMEKTVQDQVRHTELVRQTEYKRALEQLKQEKRLALAEEDLLKADDIQDKIDAVKEAQKVEPPAQQVEVPDTFIKWSADNQWYKMDSEMRDFADAIGIVEHKKGKSPEEVLKAVTEKVKKEFPDKFRNPNKDKAPSVETQVTSGPTKKGSTFKPTAEQRAIAKRFADSGVMTEDQYYKDLQAMQELE